MRFLSLALCLVATLAIADPLPGQRDVKAYLDTKIQSLCGKTATETGNLASQMRVVCVRDHHGDHDWHACADAVAAAWCAGN